MLLEMTKGSRSGEGSRRRHVWRNSKSNVLNFGCPEPDSFAPSERLSNPAFFGPKRSPIVYSLSAFGMLKIGCVTSFAVPPCQQQGTNFIKD